MVEEWELKCHLENLDGDQEDHPHAVGVGEEAIERNAEDPGNWIIL